MADVRQSAFMLSSATIMVAPAFEEDVFALTPDKHSVGMARDIAVGVDSSLVELKNGIAQATVEGRRTGVSASVSTTIFEYTAQNLLTASALAKTALKMKRGKLTSAAAAAAVSLELTSFPVPGDANSALTTAADIPAGSMLLLQKANSGDYVFPTKSSAAATLATSTYTVPIADPYMIPAGMDFAVDDLVWIVDEIPVADMDADDLFGVKISGTLSNYNRPVTVIFPKVRLSKGFQLSYSETDYGSMPLEFTPLLLSMSEATGRLSEIGTRAPGKVYIGA